MSTQTNPNTCQVCSSPAIHRDAALCVSCSGQADWGELVYDPDLGWVSAAHAEFVRYALKETTRNGEETRS